MAFDSEPSERLAFDFGNRYFDADGRMHVRVSHISKATVSPYSGREIPDAEDLGLDPNRIYHLLRDPEELARGAVTSNNIPLLRQHVVVTPDDARKDDVVGSTGTDALFSGPYLDNSLVIWDAAAIAGVESEQQRELSCCYRYVADMTPGEYQGLRFDGIMRNIVFNHVALVPQGRAGPDVYVGDSALEEDDEMATTAVLSRKAQLVRGALAVSVKPLLAADAKVDFTKLVAGITQDNFKGQKATILTRLEKATKGKLAADMKLDGVSVALDAMEDEDCAEDEDDDDVANDEDEDDKAMDENGNPIAGKAMDAKAVTALVNRAADQAARTAESNTVARMNAIFEARGAVRPYIGEIATAMDSAEAVYRFALDAMKVTHDGITEVAALKAIVGMQPKPGTTPAPRRTFAEDSANDDFNTRFPTAARIRHA